MKKDTHPEWYPEAKVFVEGEEVMTIGSTKPEIRIAIWSGNHPFYTGQQRIVDTEGQVDRFMKRLQRRQELAVEEEVEEVDPREYTIDAIGLEKRAADGLEAAGLETVGAVVDKLAEGDDALLELSGFGQKALITVKRYLRSEELID